MQQPIRRGDSHWCRNDSGQWLKWNAATKAWEFSSGPPPPPPPPPLRSAIASSHAPGAGQHTPTPAPENKAASRRSLPSLDLTSRGLQAALALVVVVALAIGAAAFWPEAEGPAPNVLRVSAAVAVAAAPQTETPIYEQLGRMQGCWDENVVALIGQLGRTQPDRPGFHDDISRIARHVETLRHRSWKSKVPVKIVPRSKIGKLALSKGSPIDDDEVRISKSVLVKLGLMEPSINLKRLATETVTEDILGFYIPKRKKLFAGGGDRGLEPMDETVLAHELGHALVDQTIGLPRGHYKDASLDDRALAEQSLFEGDASLLMTHYAFGAFGLDKGIEMFTQAAEVGPAAGAGAGAAELPYIMRRQLEFPYFEGLLFVCRMFSMGGWDQVDKLYAAPPKSSDQILFPDRYFSAREPGVPLQPPTPESWKHLRHEGFGAAQLLWLLQSPDARSAEYDPQTGVERVKGWRGGRFDIYTRKDQIAFAASFLDGGVESDSGVKKELCKELTAWHAKTFPKAQKLKADAGVQMWRQGSDIATLACGEQGPRLVIAPDEKTAAALAETTQAEA